MELMSSNERIETAIAVEKPDRVPIAPLMDFFSARYGGITQYEMFFDIKKADMALRKTIEDLGYLDAQHLSYGGLGRCMQMLFPVPPQIPGIGDIPEDGQFQFVEKSIMEPEEYARVVKGQVLAWFLEKMRAHHEEFSSPLKLAAKGSGAAVDVLKIRKSMLTWKLRGLESFCAFNMSFTPLEGLSMGFRSFNDFIMDLFRRPEEVKTASKTLMTPLKMMGYMLTKVTGVKRVFLGGTRTSASCISPKQFEEFALYEWLEMVEFYVNKGITPILHWDSDWTAFFPYLKEFPARKCVLNLDGTSDIFKAKELVGDHMCIMGDVPAALLKLGEPEEVEEYCKKLIDVVGQDGGFILSSGCTVPPDAKPENVKAMIDSVKRYGYYR